MSYFNFFNETNQEYDIYNDNTKEFIEMYGIPVLYLPRTAVKEDTLFGEDTLSTYSEVIECKMYLEDFITFGGARNMYSQFGLEIDDTMKLKIQQDYMKELLGDEVPKISDLIQLKFNNNIFEIVHVEQEEIFYLLGKTTTYTFNCKKLEYSGEIFNTNNVDTDIINNETKAGIDDSIQDFNTVLNFDETNPFGN